MPVLYSTPDGRVGALESALGDQAVEDPLRGVALPGPAAPVLQQPRVDQGYEGLQQGRLGSPADRRRPLGEVWLPQVLPRRGLRDPGVPGDRGDGRPAPSELLISSILATPIISFPASHRRNRSSDNVRPNGMVGVSMPKPESIS